MVSWVVIDRAIERERQSNSAYRKKTAGRPMRSDAKRLADSELIQTLRSLGVEIDRATLGDLCDEKLSAEEMAEPLIDQYESATGKHLIESDWIWICLTALWERWFPDKPSFEMLDDKIQAGYESVHSGDVAAACRVWLDAWKYFLHIIDKARIDSIEEFDRLFRGTEPAFNWVQDLEDELWNAGFKDTTFLADRVIVCEEGLKRFESEDQLMTENRRRALAESYFELGETRKAEELYQGWLKSDPQWGWGWVGWSDCYGFTRTGNINKTRAEELLVEGLAIPEIRDREELVDRLVELYEEQGRLEEAAEIARQADSIHQSDEFDLEGGVMRHKTSIRFGGEGLPLDELPNLINGMRRLDSFPDEAGSELESVKRKVGRNQPCPCGSGKKFKKCCG